MRHHFKAKAFAVVMAACMAVSSLAGCGSGSSGSDSDSGSTETGTFAKHLTFAQTQSFTTLDPTKDYDSWNLVRAGILETLTVLDDDMQPVGRLVEDDFSVSEDGLTWTFTVKDGIEFSNGTVLTGDLAAAGIQRVLDEADRAVDFFSAESVTADGQTLTIKTTTPCPTLPGYLADPLWAIIDTSADISNVAEDGPIGTGPYIMTGCDATNNTVNLTANHNYHGGNPRIETIDLIRIEDSNTLAMTVLNGEVDVAYGIGPADLEMFSTDDSYTVNTCSGLRTDWGFMNRSEGRLLADPELRAALIECLDMETICNVQLAGAFHPGYTPFGASGFGIDELANPHPFNIESARNRLETAGYADTNGDGILETTDGEDVVLDVYTYESRAELPIIMEALQASAGQIGVQINAHITSSIYDTCLDTGDYDIAILNSSGFHGGDPSVFLNQYFRTGGLYSNYGYSSPEADALIDRLDETFDTDDRQDLIIQISEILMNDTACAFFSYPQIIMVSGANVSGVNCTPCDYYWITADLDIN